MPIRKEEKASFVILTLVLVAALLFVVFFSRVDLFKESKYKESSISIPFETVNDQMIAKNDIDLIMTAYAEEPDPVEVVEDDPIEEDIAEDISVEEVSEEVPDEDIYEEYIDYTYYEEPVVEEYVYSEPSTEEPSYSESYTSDTSSFMSDGVWYDENYRYTWYSSNALYHYRTPEWTAGEDNIYRDSDGYVVVASSDYPQGTVIEGTPFGDVKVYDSGCASGTLDVYVNY